MRVQFEHADRNHVTQILWKDKGRKTFVPCSTTIRREQPYISSSQHEIDLLEALGVEGRKKLITHLKRERNPKLVAAKKAAVLAAKGTLACEICSFIFYDKYGELGKGYCEVHHRKPLADGGIRQTALSDHAILCSNCHRMIHRTAPMLSVEMFRKTCLTSGSSRPATPPARPTAQPRRGALVRQSPSQERSLRNCLTGLSTPLRQKSIYDS